MQTENSHFIAAIRCRDINGEEFYRAGLVGSRSDAIPSLGSVLRDIQGGTVGKYISNVGKNPEEALAAYRNGINEEINRLKGLLSEIDGEKSPLLTFDTIEGKVLRR